MLFIVAFRCKQNELALLIVHLFHSFVSICEFIFGIRVYWALDCYQGWYFFFWHNVCSYQLFRLLSAFFCPLAKAKHEKRICSFVWAIFVRFSNIYYVFYRFSCLTGCFGRNIPQLFVACFDIYCRSSLLVIPLFLLGMFILCWYCSIEAFLLRDSLSLLFFFVSTFFDYISRINNTIKCSSLIALFEFLCSVAWNRKS